MTPPMDFQVNDNYNGRRVYTTKRKLFSVSRYHLDFLLSELWDKTQEIRSTTNNYASLRFMYKESPNSPIGIGVLQYDWAAKSGNASPYNGFDSLEGNRFEITVDVPGKKDAIDFGCLAVIEKGNNDFSYVYVNKIESLVNPQSFYELIRTRANSETELTKNKNEYISKPRILLGYLLHRLTAANPEQLWKEMSKRETKNL